MFVLSCRFGGHLAGDTLIRVGHHMNCGNMTNISDTDAPKNFQIGKMNRPLVVGVAFVNCADNHPTRATHREISEFDPDRQHGALL